MSTKELTEDRGKNYGKPYDHFTTTQGMYDIWRSKRFQSSVNIPAPLEKCLRHIVYFILDKLARMAENPMHMDNFDDIGGYASLWSNCLEESPEEF